MVAPGYTKKAIEILKKKQKLILINSKNIPKHKKDIIKSVRMGTLVQQNNKYKKLSKKISKLYLKIKKSANKNMKMFCLLSKSLNI